MALPFLVFVFIFVSLSLGYFGVTIWFSQGWFQTATFHQENTTPSTRVSVIIPARNEANNIINCLNSLTRQNYPPHLFEVIVIDDHSTDDTFELANSFPAENVNVIQLNEEQSGDKRSYKKMALEKAVEQASGELIVNTDADCVMKPGWLSAIAGYYEAFHPKMIAGPVQFHQEQNLLQLWQSMDMAGMMGITAGAIKKGMPVMCNGANLAYEKSVFKEVKGYQGVDHLPSGDDILLMLKVKQLYPKGIHFVKSPVAIVSTLSPRSFSAFFSQRMRWLSKSTQFGDSRITGVLVLAYLFNLSVLVAVVAGLLMGTWIAALGIVLFCMKVLIEIPLLYSVSKFYGKQLPWAFFPIAQVAHLFYVLIAGILARRISYTWKGRVYR